MTTSVDFTLSENDFVDLRLNNLGMVSKPYTNWIIINSEYERFTPTEPIVPEIKCFNIGVINRGGNIYTRLCDTQINLNVKFETLLNGSWTGVGKDRMAAPMSGLLNTIFSSLEVRANDTVITDSVQYNTHLFSILNKLTVTKSVRETQQITEGVIDEEDVDPDLLTQDNWAHYKRVQLYGTGEDVTSASIPAKEVQLTGRLFFDFCQVEALWFSSVKFNFRFIVQDDKLIINVPKEDNNEYRIIITGVELQIIRNTINEATHNNIVSKLSSGKILYQYQQMSFLNILIPGNISYYESNPLFSSRFVPPVLLVFFQKEKRHMGDYHLAANHYDMPGGYKVVDGKKIPRLDTIDVRLCGKRADNYYSSIQNNVTNGFLKKSYLQLFKVLQCYYSTVTPNITFTEFTNYFTIFAFSFTASETIENGEIPLCHSGSVQLRMTFNSPTPADEIQTCFILGISPSLLQMDANSHFIMSNRK